MHSKGNVMVYVINWATFNSCFFEYTFWTFQSINMWKKIGNSQLFHILYLWIFYNCIFYVGIQYEPCTLILSYEKNGKQISNRKTFLVLQNYENYSFVNILWFLILILLYLILCSVFCFCTCCLKVRLAGD